MRLQNGLRNNQFFRAAKAMREHPKKEINRSPVGRMMDSQSLSLKTVYVNGYV
jgi:hypothetical protein